MRKTVMSWVAFAGVAMAQVPQTVLFQGTMSGSGGPVNELKTLSVDLCDAATAGTCTQVFTGDVMVQNGAFVLDLGSPSLPLPAFDRPMWAKLTVAGEVLSNRVALAAAPYALRAAVADSARVAWKADTSSKAGLASLAKLATHSLSADAALLADTAKAVRGTVLGGYVRKLENDSNQISTVGTINADTITLQLKQSMADSAVQIVSEHHTATVTKQGYVRLQPDSAALGATWSSPLDGGGGRIEIGSTTIYMGVGSGSPSRSNRRSVSLKDSIVIEQYTGAAGVSTSRRLVLGDSLELIRKVGTATTALSLSGTAIKTTAPSIEVLPVSGGGALRLKPSTALPSCSASTAGMVVVADHSTVGTAQTLVICLDGGGSVYGWKAIPLAAWGNP